MSDSNARDAILAALDEAAAFEHAVICQYLYAAFSLKKHPQEGGFGWAESETVRSWQTTLYLVARQEMEHLGMVWNLTTALGGRPNIHRADFPVPCPVVRGGQLTLGPFGLAALDDLMAIEKSHENASSYVASLYRGIAEMITSADFAGTDLFSGPERAQVTHRTLQLNRGMYDMELARVTDLNSALAAIDQIVEAGDGHHHGRGDNHLKMVTRCRDELERMTDGNSTFNPVRNVVANPSAIDNPVSLSASKLFDATYQTMMLIMDRFYLPDGISYAERMALNRTAFFPMMTMIIRPLGEMLTQMPLGLNGSESAGPLFTPVSRLIVSKDASYVLDALYVRLKEHAAHGAQLTALVSGQQTDWATVLAPRFVFLADNLARLASNFASLVKLDMPDLHRIPSRS